MSEYIVSQDGHYTQGKVPKVPWLPHFWILQSHKVNFSWKTFII